MTRGLLSSTSALALGFMIGAAGPLKADAMHDAAVWEFYLGAHAGLGWLNGKLTDGFGDEKVDGGTRGVLGALAGVTLRQGYWLFGLEGDIGFSTKNHLSSFLCDFSSTTCKAPMNYHFRGRLGRMVTPNIDVFIAGGLALLHVKFSEGGPTNKKTMSGLSIGAGADIKLGNTKGGLNPVLRIEALYDHYGKKKLNSNYTAKSWDDFTVRAAAIFPF